MHNICNRFLFSHWPNCVSMYILAVIKLESVQVMLHIVQYLRLQQRPDKRWVYWRIQRILFNLYPSFHLLGVFSQCKKATYHVWMFLKSQKLLSYNIGLWKHLNYGNSSYRLQWEKTITLFRFIRYGRPWFTYPYYMVNHKLPNWTTIISKNHSSGLKLPCQLLHKPLCSNWQDGMVMSVVGRGDEKHYASRYLLSYAFTQVNVVTSVQSNAWFELYIFITLGTEFSQLGITIFGWILTILYSPKHLTTARHTLPLCYIQKYGATIKG